MNWPKVELVLGHLTTMFPAYFPYRHEYGLACRLRFRRWPLWELVATIGRGARPPPRFLHLSCFQSALEFRRVSTSQLALLPINHRSHEQTQPTARQRRCRYFLLSPTSFPQSRLSRATTLFAGG